MTAYTAPIALFVYNRPEHTRRTLAALRANVGADRSKLYIFADGPKEGANDLDLQRIDEVHAVIRQVRWCRAIEIVEADRNQGLARNICTGVSSVLNSHDRIIVLEDDLETSPGFLTYMNQALEIYRDEEQVFQVSGFMVRSRPWISQTGFLRVSSSWGWGTWRRAWAHYRNDAKKLLNEVGQRGRSRFDLDGYSFHFEELQRNVTGALNTWAVKWYASVFLNDGLCLYPRKSLVRNLGFDGSGVNCHSSKTDYYGRMRVAKRTSVKRRPIVEDGAYLNAMQRHFRRQLEEWTGTRLRDRVRNKVGRVVGWGRP